MSEQEREFLEKILARLKEHGFMQDKARRPVILSIHELEDNYLTFDVLTLCKDNRYICNGGYALNLDEI